jgi:hypothetical protein
MSAASGCNKKRFSGGAVIQKERHVTSKGFLISRAKVEQSTSQQFFGLACDDDSIGLDEQLRVK